MGVCGDCGGGGVVWLREGMGAVVRGGTLGAPLAMEAWPFVN